MTFVRYMTASSSSNINWYATPSMTGWLNWLPSMRIAYVRQVQGGHRM